MAAGAAEAYFAVATLLVMALSAGMFWRYAQRPFSLIVAIPVFVSWTLGLLSTAALPYDVVQSSDGTDTSLENMWYGIYWSTWLLSWVVNPLISMALSSGAFNWRNKLKLSIKLNLRFYLIALVVVVIAIIVLLAQGTLAAQDLLPLLISLSNTYGLLLLWRSADSAAELERAAVTAVGLEGIEFDAKHDLKDIVAELQTLQAAASKTAPVGALPDAMREMWALVPRDVDPRPAAQGQSSHSADSAASGAPKRSARAPAVQEEPSLLSRVLCGGGEGGGLPPGLDTMDEPQLLAVATQVHRRLIAAAAAHATARGNWLALLQSVTAHESALQARRSAVPPQGAAWLRWAWAVHAAPVATRALAVLTACASVFVVLCEVFLPLQAYVPNANFMGLLATGGASTATGGSALAAGVCLAFMSWAMYFTLFRLSALGLELTPGGHTHGSLLLDQSGTLCRLQFALAFNYLNMAALPWRTAFSSSLGKNVQLSALDRWLPLLLLGVIVLCAANCLGRVMGWLGLPQPDLVLREAKAGGNEELAAQVQRGRQLLERGKRELAKGGAGGGAAGGGVASSAADSSLMAGSSV